MLLATGQVVKHSLLRREGTKLAGHLMLATMHHSIFCVTQKVWERCKALWEKSQPLYGPHCVHLTRDREHGSATPLLPQLLLPATCYMLSFCLLTSSCACLGKAGKSLPPMECFLSSFLLASWKQIKRNVYVWVSWRPGVLTISCQGCKCASFASTAVTPSCLLPQPPGNGRSGFNKILL